MKTANLSENFFSPAASLTLSPAWRTEAAPRRSPVRRARFVIEENTGRVAQTLEVVFRGLLGGGLIFALGACARQFAGF